MKIVDFQCWLVLFASLITASTAVMGLIADRYRENMAEHVALVAIAFSGFVVTLQIWAHGFAQMSGMASMSVSVALYAASRAWKKWKELYA